MRTGSDVTNAKKSSTFVGDTAYIVVTVESERLVFSDNDRSGYEHEMRNLNG